MKSRRILLALTALVPVALLGVFLSVWLMPSGPGVGATVGTFGFSQGHVGNHYSHWSALGLTRPFVVKDAQVVVTGRGCQGQVRLIGPAGQDDHVTGVSAGPLPGAPIIGRTLTPQMGPRLAVILTASTTGRCRVREIRFASHSWWRDRWTTVPGEFSVNVTRAAGVDPRGIANSPPAL